MDNLGFKSIKCTVYVQVVFRVFQQYIGTNCVVLGYYASSSGNFLQTFRDNPSFPSSKEKNPKRKLAQGKPYGVYIKKGGVVIIFQ